MWQAKKLLPCKICKIMDGYERILFVDSCSYWHYSYGFNNYVLCHWCYETLVLFEKPLPIYTLVSPDYVKESQDMREEKRWTRVELERIETYISDHDLHVLLQIIDDHGLRWSNFRNYEPHVPVYQQRTALCNTFIALRQDRIDKAMVNNQKLNEIATFKLLKHERSYVKFLPNEIINLVCSCLK